MIMSNASKQTQAMTNSRLDMATWIHCPLTHPLRQPDRQSFFKDACRVERVDRSWYLAPASVLLYRCSRLDLLKLLLSVSRAVIPSCMYHGMCHACI